MLDKKIIYSGIQPTGVITIGNYIGAIKNWVKLSDSYNSVYSIVNMHAMTTRQDPGTLRNNTLSFFAQFLACGLNPDREILYIQSQVKNHAQLTWILNCFTYIGEMNRMTQFKEKSEKNADNINMGLMSYPILMAADILLYGTHLVPVGADQKQHLEFTRDIAIRFNNYYGDVFTVPEPYIPEQGARIYSLQAPLSKMSKSDANPNGYISIIDPPETIMSKFKRAVTDSGKEIKASPDKPGITNLLTIYCACSGRSIKEAETEFGNLGYGEFKIRVAESVIDTLRPVREKYNQIIKDKSALLEIARQGAQKADKISTRIIEKVEKKIGFIK
ncbi:MAG: tryptophan--tRNA ligase [Christensenellales bacterium]|jgi:tryptophanyl-tRNA synthetase